VPSQWPTVGHNEVGKTTGGSADDEDVVINRVIKGKKQGKVMERMASGNVVRGRPREILMEDIKETDDVTA
jgi:hypothetical protein